MHRLFTHLLLIGLLYTVGIAPAQAQNRTQGASPPATLLSELEAAWVAGKPNDLLAHAADRIEIALEGPSKLFTRTQARYLLQAFFEEYPPQRFALRETSKTTKNWLAEGLYWHKKSDQPLRVLLRLRKSGTAWKLREMLITKAPS